MTGDDKIDILITRFLSGEALPEEAMELEDWINKSPENSSYFKEYSRIAGTTIEITAGEKNRVWKQIGDPKPIKWKWAGIAASVALIVTVGLLTRKYTKEQPDKLVHRAEATSKKVLLKDNSEIIVSPNSSISIDKDYGVRNRKITLKGSASFSVIHDPSLILIVDMSTFHIRDLGTRFSVITTPISDTIVINVAEGQISAYDDFGSSENAGAGEKVVYIRSKRKIDVFPGKRDTIVITPPRKEEKKPPPVKLVVRPAPPDSAIAKQLTLPQVPANEGDTALGRETGGRRDSTPSERIVTDLVRDGLIVRGQPLHFILSDTAFILNGKKQQDGIWERYRDKYGGKPVPAGWSWGHGENNP